MIRNKNHFPAASKVEITDLFWGNVIEKIREVTVFDVLKKFEECGAFDNFRIFSKKNGEKHRGKPYYDGLVYEVIRGASDLLGDKYDERLDKTLDGYIDIILKAQCDDGFIGTYTETVTPNTRFGMNGGVSYWQHDIYNSGAFIDAGIHHYLATGKTKLLQGAVRLANYLCSEMGKPPKKNIVPDHSLAEEAMLKLHFLFKGDAELTAEFGARPDDYLELTEFWINNRGNHKDRVSYPKSLMQYAQDSIPLRYEDEAVGHAVRGVLLYSAAAALALYTNDRELKDACERIWKNVTETKMHITGGVGVQRGEECFGFQYQLPNNAYLETCAAIGNAFWAANMCLLTGKSGTMDVFERALCNNVLAALSEKGDRYFYENPLVSDGDIERWEWHYCPCCPPMMLKIFSSLKTYIYSFDENAVRVNLYYNSRMSEDGFEITQSDKMFVVKNNHKDINKIAFRIPDYSDNFMITVNGNKTEYTVAGGYAGIDLPNGETAEISVSFDTPVIRLEGHPYIKPFDIKFGVARKVAVMRGPFIYCAEGVDNGGGVDFKLKRDPNLLFDGESGAIIGDASEGQSIRLVPYYYWNNRGKSPMRVWIPQDGMTYSADVTGWDGLLYRRYKG